LKLQKSYLHENWSEGKQKKDWLVIGKVFKIETVPFPTFYIPGNECQQNSIHAGRLVIYQFKSIRSSSEGGVLSGWFLPDLAGLFLLKRGLLLLDAVGNELLGCLGAQPSSQTWGKVR
jgi:hypothetical protein